MFFTIKQATTLYYKSKSYPPIDLSIDSLIVEYTIYLVIGIAFNAIIPEENIEIFWGVLSQII